MRNIFPLPPENNRLRIERLGRRLAQNDLAERSGVPQPRISAIECCRCRPSARERLRLSAALGLAAEEIFPDSGELK
jgi:transcriptional regulator with XRE-family HTH domain